jgi:hypothetical protein
MKRFAPVIALVIAAVVLGAVNATVFAYRWMQGTVTVKGPTEAKGVACVGFYSSGSERSYGGLPAAGTNNNAPTYGTYTISVTPYQVVCQWATYSLYESIDVTIPVTVGSWYIKDFYGFGYYGTASDPTVYVYIKVEDLANEAGIYAAYLYIYKGSSLVAEVDLKTGSVTYTSGTNIPLNSGEGLQLDLFIRATDTTTATFKVGFYVTYSSTETPR